MQIVPCLCIDILNRHDKTYQRPRAKSATAVAKFARENRKQHCTVYLIPNGYFCHYNLRKLFFPLDEAIASRAVFDIVSGSDGRTDGRADGNAFGAS